MHTIHLKLNKFSMIQVVTLPPYVSGIQAVTELNFLSRSKSTTLHSDSRGVSLSGSNLDIFVNSSMIGAENVCLGSLPLIVIG